MSRSLRAICLVFLGMVFCCFPLSFALCKEEPTNRGKIFPKEKILFSNGITQEMGGECPKKNCVTVFIAPWCPVCKRMFPLFRELQNTANPNDTLVTIVIGLDKSRKNLNKLAQALHFPVALDLKNIFFDRLDIVGVPYFTVTDQSGKTTADWYGSVENLAELKENLKLTHTPNQ